MLSTWLHVMQVRAERLNALADHRLPFARHHTVILDNLRSKAAYSTHLTLAPRPPNPPVPPTEAHGAGHPVSPHPSLPPSDTDGDLRAPRSSPSPLPSHLTPRGRQDTPATLRALTLAQHRAPTWHTTPYRAKSQLRQAPRCLARIRLEPAFSHQACA